MPNGPMVIGGNDLFDSEGINFTSAFIRSWFTWIRTKLQQQAAC